MVLDFQGNVYEGRLWFPENEQKSKKNLFLSNTVLGGSRIFCGPFEPLLGGLW